jgi:RNA polymerase sigma-70 factor (ECF subfamily)
MQQLSSIAVKVQKALRDNSKNAVKAANDYQFTERDVTSVWRIARRLGVSEIEADDVTQEVFVVASEKRDKIFPGKERAFLYGVTLRIARQRFASAKRVPIPSKVEETKHSDPNPEDLLDQYQARQLLDRLLADFPLELRAVFVLYEIEDLSMAEIAESLEIPAGTVASRLHRARKFFRQRVARWKASQPSGGGRR